MIAKSPAVLIIIVTWNKKSHVMDLLASLASLEYDQQAFNILLVDNASSDGTAESVSSEFPHVEIIRNDENLGGTGGFNTGLQWAFSQPEGRYDYLWLLDNDVQVNRYALVELVTLLEKNQDAAIAGSSMIQLDYPWRINEVGAYYNPRNGELFLNCHGESVERWKGVPIQELLRTSWDLADYIPDFNSFIDVDYVAAASLLVRADVAKKAGVWNDFFIHYDDVEWCLRIAGMGHRVLASCRSLIWHESAAAKIPTWVLYYDTRNALDVLERYGEQQGEVMNRAIATALKRAFYYFLIGRSSLAKVILQGVDDYQVDIKGKKEIQVPSMQNHRDMPLERLPFMDPRIKRILIPWCVNLYDTGLQEILIHTIRERSDLEIEFLSAPGGIEIFRFPHARFIGLPTNKFQRYNIYRRLRNQYDLVLQSEYERFIPFSFLGKKVMFVSKNSYCVVDSPEFKSLCLFFIQEIFQRWPLGRISRKIREMVMMIFSLKRKVKQGIHISNGSI